MTLDGRATPSAISDLTVRLLGSFELRVAETAVRIGSASQRRILSMLALHAGSVVSTTTLIDALWPLDPPDTAVVSLRNQISRLRVFLGGVQIDAVPPGYCLRIAQDQVDLHCFEQSTADRKATVQQLDDALNIWRGPPLEEFSFDDWARPTVSRLSELHIIVRERRLALLTEQGRHDEVVAFAEALVAESPE